MIRGVKTQHARAFGSQRSAQSRRAINRAHSWWKGNVRDFAMKNEYRYTEDGEIGGKYDDGLLDGNIDAA